MGTGDAGDLPCDSGIGEDGTRGGVTVSDLARLVIASEAKQSRLLSDVIPGRCAASKPDSRDSGSGRSLSSGAHSRDPLGPSRKDQHWIASSLSLLAMTSVTSSDYSPASR